MSIGVGSFSDPDDIPGLAHFLEHMVFMGSEKFPEENALDVVVKVSYIMAPYMDALLRGIVICAYFN